MRDLFSPFTSGRNAASGLRLSDQQRLDWLRLYRSENIGPRTFQALLNRFGGATAALDALPEMLKQQGGRAISLCSVADAEREMETARRHGARFLARGEPDYPAALAAIDAGPPLVAAIGRLDLLNRPAVALVGSRNASAVGLKMTERLASGLSEAGFVIVSGLARGIDTRAHHVALAGGTVGVLAGGLDKPYPPDNAALFAEMAEKGVILAEMPFGWEPRGRDFPRRNRIISGLSFGTIVVEAARKSGSLITARFALDQNREVFAVPGSPLDPRAEGTNDLIRQGATMALTARDVIDVLLPMVEQGPPASDGFMKEEGGDGMLGSDEPLWEELSLPGIDPAPAFTLHPGEAFEDNPQKRLAQTEAPQRLTEAGLPAGLPQPAPRERILSVLGPAPAELDDVMRSAAVSPRDLHATLLDLELEGRIERHGGNRISLPGG